MTDPAPLSVLLGLVAFAAAVAAVTLLIWWADRPTERRTRDAAWDSRDA